MPETDKLTAEQKAKPYHAMTKSLMREKGWTRKHAMHQVQKRHPEARAAFIEESRERCPGGLPVK